MFQNKQILIQFSKAYLCTTGSLHCGIFRVCSFYTYLSLHCGHVQLCDISVSNPFVTPIHNRTTCVDMVFFFFFFLQNKGICVLKDIVDVKQFLDKNLTSFIRLGIQASYYTSFVKFCWKLYIGRITEN